MKQAVAALLAALVPLAAPAAADAGWSSVANVGLPVREGAALVFREPEAGLALSVTPLSPHVVRVRFVPRPAFGRDHSYAVVPRAGEPFAAARYEVLPTRSLVDTGALRVVVDHAPLRVVFEEPDGASLDADDAALGTAFAGSRVKVWKRLRDDERVYGFGEKTGRLDKRGWQLGGYSYAMWNSDTFAYDAGTDPVYASVPFFMVLRGGRAHGIFLDETRRSFFDVGREYRGLLSFGVEGGELDYYFIDGPDPKQVLERYAALTGRMPLPPLWSLGFHQCRYSYYPEAKLRWLADAFRLKRIPADTLWLDIHHLDGYNPFTWDRERFPDPARMLAELRRQGFRVVTIVDPHPKKQPGWAVYDSGLAGGHYVLNPDGSVYEAPVWPANAERDPAPSVFPDFSRPAARGWWGGLYRELVEQGVAGIWNDMNEPAVFVPPTWTMPLELRHDNEGEPADHGAVHNVYGQLMTRATHEGLLRLRPDARPFVLTRATFAGGQRYAAVWPGDNSSSWADLRQSLPMLLGMGLSGLPFVGSDIGGFAGEPSAELFTRWLQAGVFYPFMRVHTALGTPDQEPWSYGPRHEAANRRAIELRYELLPHVYSLMEEASRTGVPPLRPLFLEFPRDERTWGLADQFLLGASLLAAPVLEEAVTERELYLPEGDWFDYWTGARHAGGGTLRVPVALESLPLYVRAGAFLFRQPVVQHTGEMPGQPLRVSVYPAPASEATLYEDAGDGFAYRDGGFLRRRFTQRRDPAGVSVSLASVEGRWRPAPRRLELLVRLDGEPRRVLLDGAGLPRAAAEAGAAAPSAVDAWDLDQAGFVRVRLADRFAPFEVRVE